MISIQRLLKLVLACTSLLCIVPSHAAQQDSAFLACERFSDRGQRIACLEDALEAATAAEEVESAPAAPSAPAAAPRATTAAPAAPAVAPAPVVQAERATQTASTAEADTDGPSLLERLRNFGQRDTATLSTADDGQEQLHDTIATLEKRKDLWIVTLASGQVWMQDYPRSMNLREGVKVTIYRAGFGNAYRLSAEGLSGFIRVKRVR